METKKYVGSTSGGLDGYAGLRIGESYTGEQQEEGRVHILLPNGRPTSVSTEQWREWFE